MSKKSYLSVVILFFLLLLVYALGVFIRIGICAYHQDKHGFLPFTSESALLYRYALFAAEARPIPQVDYLAQYPEGLPVRHHISLGIELVMGYIYRLLPEGWTDFHGFVRSFTPFFFCLGIWGVYLIARDIGQDEFAGITAALFYAVCMPAVIRSTGQEFSRENFALPLIIFHVWFFIRALNTKYRWGFLYNSLASALLLCICLIWWEGTQIYFYILVVFAALKYLIDKTDVRLLKVFAVQIGLCVFGAVFIPYLRAHYFIISYSLLISFALLLTGFSEQYINIILGKHPEYGKNSLPVKGQGLILRYKRIVFILLAAGFIALGVSLGRYTQTYSHVQSLLFYKILFLNNKPLDPNLIPYEARILWVPALLKPGWQGIVFYFSTTLLLGLLSAMVIPYRFLKKQACRGEGLIVLGLVSTFVLYLFFNRVHVYFIFFLCLFIGYAGWFLKKRFRKLYIVWTLAAGLCLVFETAKVVANVDYMGVTVEYQALGETIDWVRAKTAEGDVILTHFNHSPPFLTYAGRAIVLHPKFESPILRQKVKEYAFSLFSQDENRFYEFCLKNKVNYFIYPAGTFSDRSDCGWRYITATPATARKTNAYKFEYRPEEMDRFVPVHENWKYKIYKVLSLEEIMQAERHYIMANNLSESRRYEEALAEYKKALGIYPNYFEAHLRLGVVYYYLGDRDAAGAHWKRGYQIKQQNQK